MFEGNMNYGPRARLWIRWLMPAIIFYRSLTRLSRKNFTRWCLEKRSTNLLRKSKTTSIYPWMNIIMIEPIRENITKTECLCKPLLKKTPPPKRKDRKILSLLHICLDIVNPAFPIMGNTDFNLHV